MSPESQLLLKDTALLSDAQEGAPAESKEADASEVKGDLLWLGFEVKSGCFPTCKYMPA